MRIIKTSMVPVSLVGLLSILLFSCSSTKTIGSFTDSSYNLSKYQNIGIVVMHPKESTRAIIEDNIYEELKKTKVPAEPTINLFPFAARQNEIADPNETPAAKQKRVKERIEKFGIDGILLVALLNEKKEVQQRGGNVNVGVGMPISTPYGYNNYWRYYNHVYTSINNPTYYTTTSTYFLECNLYDVETGKLVRSVQTKTTDPTRLSKDAQEYGRLIAYELNKKK